MEHETLCDKGIRVNLEASLPFIASLKQFCTVASNSGSDIGFDGEGERALLTWAGLEALPEDRM